MKKSFILCFLLAKTIAIESSENHLRKDANQLLDAIIGNLAADTMFKPKNNNAFNPKHPETSRLPKYTGQVAKPATKTTPSIPDDFFASRELQQGTKSHKTHKRQLNKQLGLT